MSKVSLYGLAVCIGALVMFFWMKGCGAASGVDKIQDSLNVEKALNDTIKTEALFMMQEIKRGDEKNTRDSLIFNHKIDSQSKVIAKLEGRFNVARDSIGALYANLKTFYLNHDTVDLYLTYSNLRDQLIQANQLIFSLQISRDSADYTRDQEIVRLNSTIVTLQNHIKSYVALLTECTNNSAALYKNGSLAAKKAKGGKLFAEIAAGILAIIALISLSK